MVNHGLSTGALFLLVGMLYDRRHTKLFDEFGGLAKVMPLFAFFLVFTSLASVGLPALNGFAGEFLILAGSYRALGWPAAVATFGVVLAALYLLKLIQRLIWGPLTKDENRTLADLTGREVLALLPLCILMVWIGVVPATFLKPSEQALATTLADYRQRLNGPEVRQAVLRAAPDRRAIPPISPIPPIPPIPPKSGGRVTLAAAPQGRRGPVGRLEPLGPLGTIGGVR